MKTKYKIGQKIWQIYRTRKNNTLEIRETRIKRIYKTEEEGKGGKTNTISYYLDKSDIFSEDEKDLFETKELATEKFKQKRINHIKQVIEDHKQLIKQNKKRIKINEKILREEELKLIKLT